MRMSSKAKCALCILLIFAALIVGCDNYSDVPTLIISNGTTQLLEGDAIDGKELIDKFYSTSVPDEITDDPETVGVSEDTLPDGETVYWVKGGEVWHVKKTCQSLSRSKNILSGSVENAIAAGKTRVCKKCGG